MIHVDLDALECDLAEYYHIYEMRELPVYKVALFSCGLGEDSRIMRKMNNIECTLEQILLASAVDRLSYLVWSKTKDAERNRNRPKSILETLLNNNKEDEIMSFKDGQAFDEMRKRILEKGD